MPIRIVNWKLALLAFVFFCIFTGLGLWQLARAEQKKLLLNAFAEGTKQVPTLTLATTHSDLRFYRAQLTGQFFEPYTFLLDNKTFHGQIGYEIYSLFKADGLDTLILIDRGFIPLGLRRDVLPIIRTPQHTVTLTGMLNLPPSYVALGDMRESLRINWPLRLEFINTTAIAALIHQPIFPYVLTLKSGDPAAYAIEWKPVIMGPERHRGYALQWFALALTLLILFVALNREDKKP